MNLYQKVIAGDAFRPSRFHDLQGRACDPVAALGIFPSIASVGVAAVRRQWMKQPWWVWSAIRFVASQLTEEDRVLEFGSGYSSIWMAQRTRQVLSIETSALWKSKVDELAAAGRVSNLRVEVTDSLAGLADARRRGFVPTVVIIDGELRLQTFQTVICEWPSARMILYDDTDRSDNTDAAALAQASGYRVRSFRGFKPQCAHACETSVFTRSSVISRRSN